MDIKRTTQKAKLKRRAYVGTGARGESRGKFESNIRARDEPRTGYRLIKKDPKRERRIASPEERRISMNRRPLSGKERRERGGPRTWNSLSRETRYQQ